MHKKEYSIEIGGKTLTAIFSDLTEKAHGSVMLKYGETVVLATVVMSKTRGGYLGFFNLTVDFVEKFYAAGEILGGRFMRREGKPSNEAVLSSRIIDRTIRPLFPENIKNAVQVIVTVLSEDGDDSEILAINAASIALGVSNIPWNGPIGAIRIRKCGEVWSVSPTLKREFDQVFSCSPDDQAGMTEGLSGVKMSKTKGEEEKYDFDVVVCGKEGKINMVEASAFEAQEKEITKAFTMALEEIKKLETFQKKIIKEIGKEKVVIEKEDVPEESLKLFKEHIEPKLEDAVFAGSGKKDLDELHTAWNELVKETYPDREDLSLEDDLLDNRINEIIHRGAIENDRRADGRSMDELRTLFAQAGGISKTLHGSGIFYRGGTHQLSVLTLGGPSERYTVEGMRVKADKSFMHHYNFPPYSGGETGRATFTNRREIGHGTLAEKALRAVIPTQEEFPYTIRIVSESMASNGSSSMASVCAGTLALMDGGVPIKTPVAGIAMGLMMEEGDSKSPKYKILTDIQGPEDHFGDMDFKIAGTKKGITALQLDIKVGSIPVSILEEAMIQAKKIRLQILDTIEKEIPTPRKTTSPHAPKILFIKIKTSQIGLVIGPGGKMINGIQDETGAKLHIEDDGTVLITGRNGSAEDALKRVEEITHEYKVGEEAKGPVVKVLDFGAFVKIGPSTEGLVHVSEIAPFRVEKTEQFLKEGDVVPVKVIKVDEKGRLSLSIKEANPDLFKKEEVPLAKVK